MMKKFTLILGLLAGFALLPGARANAQDAPPLKAGIQVPTFNGRGLDGTAYSRQSLLGRVYIVDFWATWCPPCRMSMPMLQGLYDKYGARGFKVVGLSVDVPADVPHIKPLLAKMKISYPVATAPDSFSGLAKSFNFEGIPAMYVVDRHGRVRWSSVGFAPSEAKELDALVGKLMQER
jgi:thiol-disulfide isomerase/thioredoxin